MPPLIDLTGQKFGRWTVLRRAGTASGGQTTWLTRGDCGTKKVVRGNLLTGRTSSSCGCLHQNIVTKRSPECA